MKTFQWGLVLLAGLFLAAGSAAAVSETTTVTTTTRTEIGSAGAVTPAHFSRSSNKPFVGWQHYQEYRTGYDYPSPENAASGLGLSEIDVEESAVVDSGKPTAEVHNKWQQKATDPSNLRLGTVGNGKPSVPEREF